MDEILSLARICIALGFMAAASALDWRTRKVPNRIWVPLGIAGLALLAIQMLADASFLDTGQGTYNAGHFLIFIPIAVIFFDVLWDREPIYCEGKANPAPILLYSIAALVTVAMIVQEGSTMAVGQLLSIPGVMVVFIIFYYIFDYLKVNLGGADYKALMALSILFPVYPIIESLPLIPYPEGTMDMFQMMFPFSFLILMNAAIIHVAVIPLSNFIRNLMRKDFDFPAMFLGYRMDIEDVPKNFVWPMEVVRTFEKEVDGKKVQEDEIVLLLRHGKLEDVKEELEKLGEKGVDRIWVGRKVPFMIPMTLSILLSFIVGNLEFLFF